MDARTAGESFGHALMTCAKSAPIAVGISESGFGAPVCAPLAVARFSIPLTPSVLSVGAFDSNRGYFIGAASGVMSQLLTRCEMAVLGISRDDNSKIERPETTSPLGPRHRECGRSRSWAPPDR